MTDLLAGQTLRNQFRDFALASRKFGRPGIHSRAYFGPYLEARTGSGFRGPGESYETSDGVPLPGFRSDDLVTIRHAGGIEGGELDWNRTPRGNADGLHVSLGPGDWVFYDIVTSSPSRFEIVVASKPPALAISIDGAPIDIESAAEATVRGTTHQLDPGRHVVRLAGLLSETLVRSIEVAPAPGA